MAVLHKTKQAPLRRSFTAPMWSKYEAIINNKYVGPLCKLAASDESGGFTTDPALVQEAIGRANAVVNRLEALKAPTIAVIHGFCLGGGLEIALACKWRIAIDGAKFGFPEVMLGLHPGLGGTARSTHLIDPLQAMTLGQDTRCPESKVAGLFSRLVAGSGWGIVQR